MMERRMMMPLDRIRVRFTSGAVESTYAEITGVDWPKALSRSPRRRKVENFNSGLRLVAVSLALLNLT